MHHPDLYWAHWDICLLNIIYIHIYIYIYVYIYMYICSPPVGYGLQPTVGNINSTSTSSSAAFHTTHQTHSDSPPDSVGWYSQVKICEVPWDASSFYIYIYIYRYIPPIGLQPSLAQILGGSTRVGRSSRWRFVRSAAKASFCLFLVRLNRSLREFLRRKWWLDGWLEVFGVDGSRNKEAKQRETFKERSPRDGWMEMWFFEEDFEMGELFVDVVLEVFCDLWTLFLGHEKTLKFCGSMLWAKIKGATLVLVSWT